MQKIKKYYRILLLVFAVFVLYITFFVDAIPSSNNGVDVDVNTSVDTGINTGDNQEKTEEQLSEPSEKEDVIISYSFDANDEKSTVFSGLLKYGDENNSEVEYNNDYDFGVFIESIAGIKNGDDGKYWQYYVNNVLGDVAADNKILKEGDNVEWRFEEVPF